MNEKKNENGRDSVTVCSGADGSKRQRRIHGIITQQFTIRNHGAINVVFCSSQPRLYYTTYVRRHRTDNTTTLWATRPTVIERGRAHCVRTRFASVTRARFRRRENRLRRGGRREETPHTRPSSSSPLSPTETHDVREIKNNTNTGVSAAAVIIRI